MDHSTSNLLETLTELERLLRASGHDGQADYIGGLLRTEDTNAFLEGLTTNDMWGGSGAVWEVLPFNTPEERRRFSQLVIKLEEEMRRVGISDPRAEEIARIFQYWLDEGII